MDYVFEHSGAFYLTRFSAPMFESVGFRSLRRTLDMIRTGGNIFRMINRQSVTNIFIRDTAITNIFKMNVLEMIW